MIGFFGLSVFKVSLVLGFRVGVRVKVMGSYRPGGWV